ncbi:amidohydrolase family protein [Paenibacillus sp. 19GGS1-52]|uniref:amidohydrolase family protein n=1 Tax=Paenibacillus sp. 19GGS1-52 TaxID=2758563 RepID=UPI001EFAAE71|nr:amidohydrolase family protein [Paenibacillus sp. 19GGS1-52]ULO04991.1 amidohydrolase family protein [Paenibacillus sp. 19GGS1-52]
MLADLEIINARLPLAEGGGLFKLMIKDGNWSSIEAQEGLVVSDRHLPISKLNFDELRTTKEVDLQGRVLLPGFVDVHMHLDKAYSIAHVRNRSGTLMEAIENYRSVVPTFSKEMIRERIIKSALRAASFGSLTLRSHLDVPFHLGREIALRTVEAALEAREMVKDFVDIQYFPMYFYDSAHHRGITEFAEETLRMGIDGVGGAPHLAPDPEAGIRWALQLATAFNRPIDLHCDESDNPEVKTIDFYSDQVLLHGYAGMATAGHLCSLSAMAQKEADRLIGKMVEAGISAVTLPVVNLYLQGRGDQGNVRRGLTRVKELLKAGVPVAAASDNIQDPFHPFGRGDMLQIGLMTAYAAHLASEVDLDTILRMLTHLPAAIAGISEYGISIGNPVGFVVLDASSGEELFQELPATRWVYNKKRWIYASELKQQWTNPIAALLS